MLLAKISRPEPQNTIRRERLFRLIDRSLRTPIIWLSAPGGSGKTTLISGYLTSRKLDCLWYQIDEGDADPASFFHYLGMAVRKASPRIKSPMPFLTPDYLNGIHAFTRRYFEELCLRISHASPAVDRPAGLLVFDDYQEVPAGSEFHNMLACGLDMIPKGIKVIFLSRSGPPPAFIRFKARNRMSFIEWSDIRFTVEETAELLDALSCGTDKDISNYLHEKADGWAAGLVLLSKSAFTAGNVREHAGGMEDVFSYFASEVFPQTERPLQKFLMKSSFLSQMTPDMAEKITGIKDARAILSELSRNNFFTMLHHENGESYYQYHPLFREFLVRQAEELFTPSDLLLLRQYAAVLLKESGDIESAAELLIEAADWEDLSLLVREHAELLLSRGRNRTVEGWLRKIPEEIFSRNPGLHYWLGVCMLPFETAGSRGYFEHAFREFIKQDDIPSALLSWAGAVETIFLERGDFTRMDRWASALKGIIEGPHSIPSGDIYLAVIKGMVEIILARTPFAPRIDVWIRRALELMGEDIPVEVKLAIADPLHLYFIYAGEHIRATELINILRHTVVISRASPLARIRWHLIEAVHSHMVDASFEECLASVEKGLAIAEETGVHLLDIPLYQTGAYASLIGGDAEASEKFLQKMKPLIKPYSFFDIGNCSSVKLSRDLLRKRYVSAFRNAVQTVRMAFRTGSPIPIFLTHLGMAQALIGLGRYRAASVQIEKAEGIMRGRGMCEGISWVYMMKAYLYLKKGDGQYREWLEKALSIYARERYQNTLHWSSDMMSQITAAALEDGIETEYVKTLIRKRNLKPPESPRILDRWPYPLRIQTLGGLSIVKDEKPLEFPGRVRRKPMELLKAIITFGGADVPDLKLMNALWPEMEGDKASQSLKFTLHALRKILGEDEFIILRGGRIGLNRGLCSVDIWTLQELIKLTEQMPPDDEPFLSLSQKALELYQGDFLEGDEMLPWTIRLRDGLRSGMTGLLRKLADYDESLGEYDKAVEICNRAIDLDYLSEEFYRKKMRIFIDLGRPSDAVLTYNRCRNLLMAELGVGPSRDTEALLKKARKI
jgi:DNA-binding SARP family transcriptional activator